MPRRESIRILRFLAAFPVLALGATLGRVQMHKVEAPQHVTRAIGVYEWTGPLDKPKAARLIPVSLFIDGHFEDAGVYLARPVPFALETGDVYSIQQAGKSLGTLDIDFARDVVTRRSVADDDPLGAWYGYGRFAPPPTLTAKSNLKPSANPSAILASNDDSSDTPHFVYRQPSSSTTTTTNPNGSTTTTTTATTSPAPDDANDPDRPTLRHRDPADDAKRTKKNNKPQGYVTPPNDSLNDDPDRPTLHRGVPPEEAMASQLTGLPPDMRQDTAVSDAANRDPHLFAREWASPTERAETLADLEVAARPRIANYLLTNKLIAAPPAPPPSAGPSFAKTPAATQSANTSAHTTTARTAAARRAAARRKATLPAPAFTLANEQLSGYTLSYGGLPTFIYTVETPTTLGTPVYLTLVAQRLPAGELQVALSSITDAGHLDRTPWMRPVDVVDADSSHRASLLMELRAQSSRQFALYRLVTAKAEQTFVTGIIE